MTVYLLEGLGVVAPEIADALVWPTLAAKLATVVAIPVALFRLAGLISRRQEASKLWWQLGTAWSALGIAAVLVVVAFGEQLALATAKPTVSRVWPGTGMAAERGLSVASDPAYTLGRMMITEMTTMVVMAWLAALCVRLTQKVDLRLIWALPLVVFGTVTVYAAVAPWAWIIDYDNFIGDAVLGGLWFELAFFWPTDAVSSIALAVGASTLSVVVWNLERRGPEARTAAPRDLVGSA